MEINEPVYNFIIGTSAEVIISIGGKPPIDIITILNFSDLSNEIDELGYFHLDKYGNKSRMGLYQINYDNKFKWLNSPKLHLEKCKTVIDLKNRMKATNDFEVTYFAKEMSFTEKLKICKNCVQIISDNSSVNISGNTFSEFILSIEEDELKKSTILGDNGYVINWSQISRAFRDSKNYKCEKCNYKIKNLTESKFMQTHHVDRNKLNNKKYNLMCLCIKCHSEVDEIHIKNFSTLENQRLLLQFEEAKK